MMYIEKGTQLNVESFLTEKYCTTTINVYFGMERESVNSRGESI